MFVELLTLAAPTQDAVFEIIASDRKLTFAGRLGKRVDDTLTLMADGKEYTVRLAPAHSRFGMPKAFEKGERIRIDGPLMPRISRFAISKA